MDYLALVLRWMHMLAAATAVGGIVFMRVALLPTVETLEQDVRRKLHEGVRARWAPVVMGAIVFLLVSGLYNAYRIVTASPGVPVAYHILFTVKLLLAFGVFFLSSALTGRSPALAPIREKRRYWLNVNLAMVIAIVLLSGVLRDMPRKRPALTTAEAAHANQTVS